MPRVIRATISGQEARVGEIAASDVARLILALERALARAAYVALGRERPSERGRHQAFIERATRLRFAGIEKGSFVELLALPDAEETADDALPISTATLADAAFDRLLSALREDTNEVDRRLAGAVADLADQLGIGDRTDWVRLESDGRSHAPGIIDRTTRTRMRAISTGTGAVTAGDDVVYGQLVEADFERRTARLQPAHGPGVTVSFTDDLDDEIHHALRSVTTLEGLVSYDPSTRTARRVDLRRVRPADELLASFDGDGSFDLHHSVVELQQQQGVLPVARVADVRAHGLTDEDREELAALLHE